MQFSASAAAALIPVSVSADASDVLGALDRGGSLSFGAGVFVGYQWSAHPGVEWGFEAFATHRFNGSGCSADARAGVGPLLQLGIMGLRNPRLTLAAQGGAELIRVVGLAASGELGLSYRFGDAPGLGIHLGVSPQAAIFTSAFRYQALRNEAWVGGGIRFLPTFGEPGACVVGRPLRSDSGLWHSTLDTALLPTAASAEMHAALGFARDAALEGASISAFLQLALELRRLAAPAALIAGALGAAHDELRHTRLCAALAERGLRRPVRCELPMLTARSQLTRSEALARLAVESWLDGCVAEAAAARQAALAADRTRDSAVSDVLRAIARDEAAHAQLAWDVLDFCVSRGGRDVRHALRASVESARTAPEVDCAEAPCGLERQGQLSWRTRASTLQAERARGHEQLRERGIL